MITRSLVDVGYFGLTVVLTTFSEGHRTGQTRLSIFQAQSVDDGVYLAAQSVEIYGASALKNLRDALNNAFPLEETKGTTT